jgi:hypothetical protein
MLQLQIHWHFLPANSYIIYQGHDLSHKATLFCGPFLHCLHVILTELSMF